MVEFAVSQSHPITIQDGVTVSGRDFGSRPTPGILQANSYEDANSNGLCLTRPKASWPVGRCSSRCRQRSYARSRRSAGHYRRPRSLYVRGPPLVNLYRVALGAQYRLSPSLPGVSDAQVWSVTLGGGEIKTDSTSGSRSTPAAGRPSSNSSLQGRLFDDVNANGVYNAGIDTPVVGATVYLDRNNKQHVRRRVDSVTTTDSAGNYRFNSLAASTYQVRVVTPSGKIQSGPFDAQLSSQTTTTSGDKAEALATGDFDRDGYEDLVVANAGTNNSRCC